MRGTPFGDERSIRIAKWLGLESSIRAEDRETEKSTSPFPRF
jgi:hypothetical protein